MINLFEHFGSLPSFDQSNVCNVKLQWYANVLVLSRGGGEYAKKLPLYFLYVE